MNSKALTTLVSQLRRDLGETADFIGQQFDPSAPVTPLLEQRCAAVDQTLTQLWHACDLDETNTSLIAVGGYGRGELFPSSDVDVLILLGQPDTSVDAQLSVFVSSLWDLGLKIGHSVRSIDECLSLAADDITVMTTLLETRLLTGPATIYDTLLSELDKRDIWKSGAFYTAKLEEQTQRHEKYGLTGYSLEPNVKSSPGGLRDIQVIGWIAKRHFGTALEQLPTGEFLTEQELDLLMSGQDYLSRVRFALHHLTGRDEDRLLFEHQQTLARRWGFEDEGKLAVEQFMQAYFRNVQAVSHVSALLIDIYQKTLLQAEASSSTVIDEDFELIDDRISARHAAVFTQNPSNLLRLFVVIGRDKRIKRIDPQTTRLLRGSADLIDEAFRDDPINRRLFRDVLSSPFSMTKQLRRMLRHGVL
ncbi:MAG: nucleotidyltransferase domain-containing protein, partial [Pseudomonadota bacterium]|nr:nucleotidyltransferase domain-containing protein [Pseudomonadota bacterium]